MVCAILFSMADTNSVLPHGKMSAGRNDMKKHKVLNMILSVAGSYEIIIGLIYVVSMFIAKDQHVAQSLAYSTEEMTYRSVSVGIKRIWIGILLLGIRWCMTRFVRLGND